MTMPTERQIQRAVVDYARLTGWTVWEMQLGSAGNGAVFCSPAENGKNAKITMSKAPAVLDAPRSMAGDWSAYKMSIPHRTCTRCREIFPATTEYFNKQKAGAFGLISWCKTCQRADSRRRSMERRLDPLAREKKREYKARPEIRARALEAERLRYKNDPEKFLERKRKWREDNPERAKAIKVRHITNNLEHYRRGWRSWAARRRATKRNTPKELWYTAADVQNQRAAQSGCYWCKAPLTDGYEVDHLIPLSKGGSNSASNIVCACKTCNRTKYNKMPWDFNGRLL